jgi:hypothetical protein
VLAQLNYSTLLTSSHPRALTWPLASGAASVSDVSAVHMPVHNNNNSSKVSKRAWPWPHGVNEESPAGMNQAMAFAGTLSTPAAGAEMSAGGRRAPDMTCRETHLESGCRGLGPEEGAGSSVVVCTVLHKNIK